MNFGFTEEQDFLRDAVRKFVDERCPIPEVRNLMETEETGRTLLASPLLSNALATMALREGGSPAQRDRWLPAFAEGTAIGTLAFLESNDVPGPGGVQLEATVEGDEHILSGEKCFVHDVGSANVFVVAYRAAGEIALALVPADRPGVSIERVPMLDETKRTGTLRFSEVRVGAADRLEAAPAEATMAYLEDCGALAVTAEGLGAMEGATAITVQYAKDRVQFGSPIGRYQGVKHRLADQWVDAESIKSLLYYGAWAVENSRDELARYASLAKAYVADAFTRTGVECVQLHGAVGYTLEYDIQLYIKRSKWVRPAFGDADFHRDRLATLRNL